MAARRGVLILLIVAILALVAFYMAGGSVDIDADLRTPSVQVEPGSLPDISVERAPEAEARSAE